MKTNYAIVLLLFLSYASLAQRQNDNWCFGNYSGVSFNGTGAITSFSSQITANETTGGVSDRHTGKLLFYTDGRTIWGAQHAIISGGGGAGYVKSATSKQGAVIVPFVDNPNKYYVFSMEHSSSQPLEGSGTLGYSVVDMSLANGVGGVVADQKMVAIDTGFTEAMTAVNNDCGDMWLLAYQRFANEFYAYKITAAGINTTPVISKIPHGRLGRGMMLMKVSPDRKKLCIVSQNPTTGTYTTLHDFDAETGQLSNTMMISTFSSVGCEFSPDSKKLYTVRGPYIFQYDLSLTTEAAIIASAKLVHTGHLNLFTLQMGPDSNIYFGFNRDHYLNRITNCNALVPNCVVTTNVVDLGTNIVRLGLPQAVALPQKNAKYITTSRRDTAVCLQKPYTLTAPDNKESYKWQDGSTLASYEVKQPGIYWVKSTSPPCRDQIDTIVITGITIDTDDWRDTTLCPGASMVLKVKQQLPETSYLWSTGATTDSIIVAHGGKYSVKLTYKDCEVDNDINIEKLLKLNIELGNDTQICKDRPLRLPISNSKQTSNVYTWSTGATEASVQVDMAGRYTVKVENICEAVYDTVDITTRNCHLFFPSAFTPNSDGKNDFAKMIGDIGNVYDYQLQIFSRWGQRVFNSNDIRKGWDGLFHGVSAEVGTYYYYAKYNYLGVAQEDKGTIILIR